MVARIGSSTERAVVSLFLLFMLVTGCQSSDTQSGVEQIAHGNELYTNYCASCHEIDGGIGPRLTEKVLSTRVNARLLFNYNKLNMPYEAGNTLPEESYWAITAYLLHRHGFMSDSLFLSQENAATISLSDPQ